MGAAVSCFSTDDDSPVSHSSRRYRRGCIGGFASDLYTRLFRRRNAVGHSLMIPKNDDDDDDDLYTAAWRAPPTPPPFKCPNSAASKGSNIYAYASPYDDDDDDDDLCPICLEEYSPENPAMELQCSHKFHLGCTFEWMERTTTCPICEKVIELKEAELT